MNVRNVFPSPWLSAEDLGDRKFELVIAGVAMQEVHDRVTNRKVQKMTVRFEGARKRLITNKTQAFALAAICGSDETNDWAGKRISLRAGRAHNGKPTIIVEKASVQAPTPQLDNANDAGDE